MTPEERHAYDEHINAIMIQNDVLDGARSEGLAEGLAKGKVEGIVTVARNLKAMNLPVEEIIKATGLSPEEIAEL